MRVLGSRRTDQPAPYVDRLYPRAALSAMLAEADVVTVAVPHTPHTVGMVGPTEFAAMKPGVLFINVSRGAVVQEQALLDALDSGRVAAAGLDVFAVEPLPAGHVLWSNPQVLTSPHVSGEVVNQSGLPAERFARNLRAWLAGKPIEGVVDLSWGY
jgi:phosphoglycerate dehydrogenase-like enzyme